MINYSYKAKSQCVDYDPPTNDKVSAEDARTMALIDIAAALRNLARHADGIRVEVDEIAGVLNGIGSSIARERN